MFTCPNCNGSLKFNIPTQKLKCEHCGSSFDPAGYDQNNNAEQDDFFGATVYTCKNCGAELISPDDSIVSFCSYCGTPKPVAEEISSETDEPAVPETESMQPDETMEAGRPMRKIWTDF